MTLNEAIHTLACPSCGGGIKTDPASPAVTCGWCGSTVLVPKGAAPPGPFAQEDEPLAVRVENLVRDGHDGRAVLILRDELLFSLPDAGKTVERIRLNEGRDAGRLIREAQEGKLE
jgi:hypothetical protein